MQAAEDLSNPTANSTLINMFAAWANSHGKKYDNNDKARKAFASFVSNLKGMVSTNTDPALPYWVSMIGSIKGRNSECFGKTINGGLA